jgi:hypothetical protein
VQLLEEQRSDQKSMHREMRDGFSDLTARVTRLEASMAAAPATSPPRTWTPAVKAGAGTAGIVALLPVVLYVLQTFGVLPPPAPGTPPPPLPTIAP